MILFLSMFKQGFRKTLPSTTRLGCCWTKASKMQSQKKKSKIDQTHVIKSCDKITDSNSFPTWLVLIVL